MSSNSNDELPTAEELHPSQYLSGAHFQPHDRLQYVSINVKYHVLRLIRFIVTQMLVLKSTSTMQPSPARKKPDWIWVVTFSNETLGTSIESDILKR